MTHLAQGEAAPQVVGKVEKKDQNLWVSAEITDHDHSRPN
jgi:hypothetical protein